MMRAEFRQFSQCPQMKYILITYTYILFQHIQLKITCEHFQLNINLLTKHPTPFGLGACQNLIEKHSNYNPQTWSSNQVANKHIMPIERVANQTRNCHVQCPTPNVVCSTRGKCGVTRDRNAQQSFEKCFIIRCGVFWDLFIETSEPTSGLRARHFRRVPA